MFGKGESMLGKVLFREEDAKGTKGTITRRDSQAGTPNFYVYVEDHHVATFMLLAEARGCLLRRMQEHSTRNKDQT